jgi:hypothetical protein
MRNVLRNKLVVKVLTENISHTDVFSLSNGDIFELPVIAHDFAFVSFVGWLDLEKLAVILQKDNLYPLAFHGRALGAISAYKYQKTSEGQFNELYFTAFASSQASQNTFVSIVELLKNIRFIATSPNPDVSLYHLNSYSNHASWHLASEEIWGIPSEFAEIEINIENKQQGFFSARE